MQTPFISRRRPTTNARVGRVGGYRRLTLSFAAFVAATAFVLAAGQASADTSSTLTVVGTSDVSDSGLVQNVIAPDFKAEFPQFTFKYVGSATGVAIQSAMSGTGGPSALIVHAPSLENQFVADGFSANQFGNAIFTNDFVLVGPTGDPAGVATNAANNIAQGFADVAAAGVAGKATFFTRGGTTTASGTTVEEHALWQLMFAAGLTPSGVVLCNVSAADGGGMSPINPNVQPTSGQPCPASGTVDSSSAPSWYFINSGATQGANVFATNACTTGSVSGANSCYTLSDRGTVDFLASGNSPAAGAGGIPSLKVVTANNSASAPGGANELVNYFHVYIINPNKPGETVNLQAAQDFVSMLTSPSFQSQLPNYLNTVSPTPLFNPTASPGLTATFSPTSPAAGGQVTVTGQLTNKQPGFATLANQAVNVDEIVGTLPLQVATGTTDSGGGYSISFAPTSSGTYEVSTGQISVIEIPSLNPAYGDLLAPASSTTTTLTVAGAVTITKTTTSAGSVNVSGTLSPKAPDDNATVSLLAKKKGSNGSFALIGSASLKAGQTSYALSGSRAGGAWTIAVQYSDPGQLSTATSTPTNVTIPARSVAVKFKKVTVKKGKLTVSASVGQAPTKAGATVQLFALKLNSKGAKFKKAGAAKLKKGRSTYTIKHALKPGRYALQLKYSNKGQSTTYSGYKYANVH